MPYDYVTTKLEEETKCIDNVWYVVYVSVEGMVVPVGGNRMSVTLLDTSVDGQD